VLLAVGRAAIVGRSQPGPNDTLCNPADSVISTADLNFHRGRE
jgi:hypothetical protein